MSQASVQTGTTPRPIDPLYRVKLLAALRAGDASLIIPLISELNKGARASTDTADTYGGAVALHLAIRCASCETIQLLLQQRPISPNAVDPPESGTTALHLAAYLGRADVVTLLLEQEADDTLRDAQGRTCKEVAKTRDVIRIIQESRALLNASYLSLLRTYTSSPANSPVSEALLKMLQSPRIRNVDLNQLDASSGGALIHEAVRRKDLRLIELAVRSGADVFVRDRRGRGVVELAGKDDRIKAYLRQFTNQNNMALLLEAPAPPTEEPTMRGYLNKYGNLAKGYNTRWFVLKDGMLSYYRHQDDENLACRGSLSMRNARIKASSTDKLRFEVHASTRNGEGIPEKWYMKANHAVEVTRWVQALQKSIDWSKRSQGRDSDVASVISTTTDPGTSRSGQSSKKRFSRATSNAVFGGSKKAKEGRSGSPASSIREQPPQPIPAEEGSSDEDAPSSKNSGPEDRPPHQGSFELLGNTAAVHLDVTLQLLSSFDESISPNAEEILTSLKASLSQAQTMFNQYTKMVQEREAWFNAKMRRERERAGIWEESLQKVVQEGEELEEELKKTIRQNKEQRRRSKVFSEVDMDATIRQRPLKSPTLLSGEGTPASTLTPVKEDTPIVVVSADTSSVVEIHHAEQRTASPNKRNFSPQALAPPPAEFVDSDDSDSDEFFDAIEANALPNMVIPGPLKSDSNVITGASAISNGFEGYLHPREHLGIDADNRPPVSLWAVLKGSIGKDLTRISFPVFFNEPTSMLQRMAEDMEFSSCLDAAVNEPDPFKRIAYVAAFAMSNYSSTIGRIAKPFNPMLGETFEYVRLDRQYTYVSEQVSHHPPISACWAESPSWHYFGEVDAKNKFAGKSFEIRPTGVAHANLKLPKSWAPTYPAAGPQDPDKVLEHYSWKKVTTNVSGFILGSPTIDHYGEMRVINHRTRDQCILTFKPRGWKAKDSFEIKGEVLNARGEVQHQIAGRWNNQLVLAANNITDLLPDVTVHTDNRQSHIQSQKYLLLWRNTVKPPAPFNLTPYAITLNDCPEDTLRPYLPPTDCRLRPDQRAFELGKYERANVLKGDQEELQRATRKKRELGEIPPHRPRWFEAKVEADTGERYWAPIRQGDQLDYWYQREQAVKAVKAGQSPEWPSVDRIFIEAEL